MLYEYPGYGKLSHLSCSEEGINSNIRRVYQHYTQKEGFSPEKVIIYGFSLGTGPSVNLATDTNYPIAGLILQAPFLSCLRCIFNFSSTKYFDFFPTVDIIERVNSPVILLHGKQDKIVDSSHSCKLAEILRSNGKLNNHCIFEKVGHNDLFTLETEQIYTVIRNFVIEACKIDFSISESSLAEEGIEMDQIQLEIPRRKRFRQTETV